MARRPVSRAEQAQLAFVALTLPSPKSRAKTPEQKARAAYERALGEATQMFQAKSFEGAEVRHVVALHGLLHTAILGVVEEELTTQFLGAVSAASKLCRDAFEDDAALLVEYVRWGWGREKSREARRRAENDTNGSRLSWRLLFASRALITDYRVAQHRQAVAR